MNKNKILIVSYEFPPIIGGAGVYAHDLAIGLKKINYEVDIATYGRQSLNHHLKSNYDINIYDFSPTGFLHLFQFFFLVKRLTKTNNYDLIILSDARAKKMFSLFIRFFKNETPKSISVFHGNEINSFFVHPSKVIKLLGINKKLLKLFSIQRKLIIVSENEKKIWEKETPQFQSKFALVRHGINENMFFKRSIEEIEKIKISLNIPLNKKIILSASRLVKNKGQDSLILALSNVVNIQNDVLLLIVGEGNYFDELKSLAEKYKISAYVRFIGGVERELLSRYYSISDLFVLPSRFHESFGLVYLEAAACGIPSISGNLGGVSDVILNGTTGIIVDSYNVEQLKEEIVYLMSNDSIRQQLGRNAEHRFLQEFTCEIMAKNLMDSLKVKSNNE